MKTHIPNIVFFFLFFFLIFFTYQSCIWHIITEKINKTKKNKKEHRNNKNIRKRFSFHYIEKAYKKRDQSIITVNTQQYKILIIIIMNGQKLIFKKLIFAYNQKLKLHNNTMIKKQDQNV